MNRKVCPFLSAESVRVYLMRTVRRIFVITCLLAITGLIWAGIYTRKQGFTHSWRYAVEDELAAQGYFIDIGKLTLGAFRGLVAEDVQFFRDKAKTIQFAEIDDIYLDVGLGRVFQKEITINTLDFQNGRLTIPIPAEGLKPGGIIQIGNLSGRVALTESFIEVVRAEANFAGIEVSVKGKLIRSPNQRSNQIETRGKEAFEATMSRIRSVKMLVDSLAEFDFPGGAPTLKVDFRGDLRDLSRTSAQMVLEANHFRKKRSDYEILSLNARAEIDGSTRQVKIPRFELKDRRGLFDADGTWNRKSNELEFDLDTNLDLVNLIEFFLPNRKWREVVFYQPPRISAEGAIRLDLLGGERPDGIYFPGQIIGNFKTEGFVSAGKVFKGSSGDFSVKEDRFYVRNVRVDHKTGVAFLNSKFEPGQGINSLQFQTAVKMDPRVFAPFLKDEGTRKFLRNWSFSDDSGVDLAASGQSSSLELEDLQAKGGIYLRDFKLNQVAFQKLEADFEIDGVERWYRNVSLSREDGEIDASLVYTNTDQRIWKIKGGVSTVDFREGFGAFSPMLREQLAPYRFSQTPTVEVQGVIDARTAGQRTNSESLNDLEIKFSSKGNITYQLLGKELPLDSPEGTLHLKGRGAALRSFKAGLCGGTFGLDFETPDYRITHPTFKAKVELEEVGLRSLGKIYDFENSAVGHVEGFIKLAGKGSHPETFQGEGQISVSDRDIFEIPFFYDLEGLLMNNERSHAPGIQSIARSSAEFRLEGHALHSDDITLIPGTANLKGSVVINLPLKTVESELSPANSNSRRVYRCTGTLKAPQWQVITGRRFTTISGL